jgi:4'-phosphopantetheinyl transferase
LQTPPALGAGEVHVWQLRLNDNVEAVEWAWVLNPAERQRAGGFRFAADRLVSAVSRAALRWLLAGYGVGPAASLQFEVGPAGKPKLAPGHLRPLEFNVAHTRGMVALAFAQAAVGIDVERVRPLADAEAIVRSHFAPEERRAWEGVSADMRERAFFNGWTRKEAFLKATGEGLRRLLDSFAVTLAPGELTRLLRVDPPGQPLEEWTLFDMTADPAFIGAVVVEARAVRLQHRLLDVSAA